MRKTLKSFVWQSAVVIGLGWAGVTCSLAATVIRVPADQPTIQTGIDAAVDGDTVLVAPGTYFENINFRGKNITVKSSNGPSTTIIDGRQNSSVVTFESGETPNATLTGFTLTHGNSYDGGGIYFCCGASPSIIRNTITSNSAVRGAGIYGIASGPLIQGNTISGNIASRDGGAMYLENGAAGTKITQNRVTGNAAQGGDGGGIYARAFGRTSIQNNFIKGNTAKGVFPASHGGGVYLQASAEVVMAQNIIVANAADQGAGLNLVVEGLNRPIILNNSITANRSSQQGSALYVGGISSGGRLYNNLFIGKGGENAVYCDPAFDPNPPELRTNDAFSPSGADYEGSCSGQTGQKGNISADPGFIDLLAHLKSDSPAIDTGSNNTSHLLQIDFDGNPRTVDGNADGKATVDMGAYEFQP